MEKSKIFGVPEIGDWYYSRKRKKAYKKAYRPQQITLLSNSLTSELENAVYLILRGVNWEQLEDYEDRLAGTKVFARFRYGERGLEVQIYGLEAPLSQSNEGFETETYDGFSPAVISQMTAARLKYNAQVSRRKQAEESEILRQVAIKDCPDFFQRWVKIPEADSREFGYSFKWQHLNEMYSALSRAEAVDALRKHRDFASTHIATLQSMSAIIDSMEARAEQVGSALCFPEIVDGQHVVAFRNLVPIHLLETPTKGKCLVPIDGLPILNGDMVGFTGFHGGGKTVASLTIPLDIYLAQSGLPILGDSLRLNVKRALGMVFIERGKGSTCEVLVEKLARVLKQALEHQGKEVVLVLDELGSATQEVSGLELGKDVLTALRKKGISVLFSTQILGLAKFAETNLGAKCFKLDASHRISAGIADGGMSELRKRSGLNKLLKSAQ
jgi:hypothetical protein